MAEVEITEEEHKKIDEAFAELVEEAEKSMKPPEKEVKEPPKVTYCMGIYEERMLQVKNCVERVRPYVDRCVIVIDDTVTEQSKKWLTQWGCEIVYRKWDNHFSRQRNAYLAPVEEGSWVLVSDPDELHSPPLMNELKNIVTEAEKQGINILGINAHDLTIQLDGTETNTISDWFKQLLFKYEEGVRYVGIVHETLLPGIHGWRPANLDRRYYYEHLKSELEIYERAFRNVWAGGGGNNKQELNPRWLLLRQITDRLGLKDWSDVREYLRKGKIDPELLQWIKDCQHCSGWDYENEMFDCLKYYKALYPEELPDIPPTTELKLPPPSKGSPQEIMNYVEDCYLKVLNRNADDTGKRGYTETILNGRIKREDLPKILMDSKEYKDKHGL